MGSFQTTSERGDLRCSLAVGLCERGEIAELPAASCIEGLIEGMSTPAPQWRACWGDVGVSGTHLSGDDDTVT